MKTRFLFFSLLTLIFFGAFLCTEEEKPVIQDDLTPAREISGTWKTTFPTKFYVKTDFCSNSLELVASEDWNVTWKIWDIPGTDDSVMVEWAYTRSNYTVLNQNCSNGTGYIPEPSPIFLTGHISSTLMKLYNGKRKVGEFSFLTDMMQGTYSDPWCMLYCQEIYTETNQLKLYKQK